MSEAMQRVVPPTQTTRHAPHHVNLAVIGERLLGLTQSGVHVISPKPVVVLGGSALTVQVA